MKLTLFQVDAFSKERFAGNPAAVCPLEEWLPDETLQAIGQENNLAETAFIVPQNGGYHLRWFTPAVEVDLCGHATLATAHVLKKHLQDHTEVYRFHTRSGELQVTCDGDQYVMNFPALSVQAEPASPLIQEIIGKEPPFVAKGMDYFVRLDTQAEVEQFEPNMHLIGQLKARGMILTAPGDSVDFVSRFFAPQSGVPEDPVTGSAHCALTPYWAGEMGKTSFHAKQLSARGGDVYCTLEGDRVALRGDAVTYLIGDIWI